MPAAEQTAPGDSHAPWNHGDLIVRREVLGYSPIGPPPDDADWVERSWLDLPVYVVEDTSEHLVTYTANGAEFGFPPGHWPSPGGDHPWSTRTSWTGHGCLMVQRPGDHHAVWHFWDGPDRTFSNWYINLQTDFRRNADGYDTQDLEVDFVVLPDGTWSLKDYELLNERVAEGRYWPELADWIRGLTAELTERLHSDKRWWDDAWSQWTPPAEWVSPKLRPDRRRT